MTEIVTKIKELTSSFIVDMDKAADGNKSAGARARKTSLELEKALKSFRKISLHGTEE